MENEEKVDGYADNNNEGVHLDEEKIGAQFEKMQERAEEILKDKEKVSATIGKAFKKLCNIVAQPILLILDDILLLLSALSAAVTGKYTHFPFMTLTLIVAALLYFLSPVDVICDFLPWIGYLDDAFLFSLVLEKCHKELQTFKEWEKTQVQDQEESLEEEAAA